MTEVAKAWGLSVPTISRQLSGVRPATADIMIHFYVASGRRVSLADWQRIRPRDFAGVRAITPRKEKKAWPTKR